MADDSLDLAGSPRRPFAVDALAEVQPSSKELPPPAFISDTFIPEDFAGERRVWVHRRPDETACGMCVE